MALQPLLEAQSVAIVGASTRKGSVGNQTVRQLLGGGFTGKVLPINPRHEQVEGIDCLDSIAEAGPVDLAVLAVANELLEGQLKASIASKARSVAIFASCEGRADDGRPLADRLQELALASSIPICGGNGMGFLNIVRNLRICGFHQPLDLDPGGITFLTHSGSLFSAMLHNNRQLRFNLAVSTGNELVTTMDQYLDYAAALASTSVIGLFLETIRNVDGMKRSLLEAADRDIPVVALKVGRTERSQQAVATHSAALAGEYGAFSAFATAHGVHLVDTMDEMADTLEIFSCRRRAKPGGLGSVHDSGGERSLLIDIADRIGVPLATVSDTTRSQLEQILDLGLDPENPVDAWGTGRAANDVFAAALRALAGDPAVGAVAFSVDLTAEEDPDDGYGRIPIEVMESTEKPVVVLANLAGSVDEEVATDLRRAGVPVLRGTETGLRAIRHLFDHGRRPDITRAAVGSPPSSLEQWRRKLGDVGQLTESDAFSLLEDFGVPVMASEITHKLSDTISAADRLGYPVALKITGMAHKSEAGGVIIGIGDRAELIHAWEALSPLTKALLVQPMAPSGVEIGLGIVVDPQYGPVLVVAAGGVLVELIGDRVTALPPVDQELAMSMLLKLKVGKVLLGHRGSDTTDIKRVAQAIVGLSNLAVHLGSMIESIDVNPLIAHPKGCVAVDALVITKAGERSVL